MSRRREARAGFTLIELMVSVGISSFLVVVAMAMVHHEVRLIGVSDQTLELTQTTRLSLNLLAEELRLAGSGVGYFENGDFGGLELGAFKRGVAAFESNGRPLNLAAGPTTTDDIGILKANGNYATIAKYSTAGSVTVCQPPDHKDPPYDKDDLVVLRSEDGLSSRAVVLGAPSVPADCGDAQCVSGVCVAYPFNPDPALNSGPDALTTYYTGGTVSGTLERTTYFVEATDPARPTLRRVVGDCPGPLDNTCGEALAENFESVQFRVYQRQDGAWVDLTTTGALPNGFDRIRVDIELVARSRTLTDGPQPEVVSALEDNTCFPACGTTDRFRRRVMRMSVEIKNSGRMHFKTAGEES